MLDNIGKAMTGKYFVPKIGRFVSKGVYGVACSVVYAFVERKKKVSLPLSLVVIRISSGSAAK
jgi:hypothetical protein